MTSLEEVSDRARAVTFNPEQGRQGQGVLTIHRTPSGRGVVMDPSQMVYKSSSLAVMRARGVGPIPRVEGEKEGHKHLVESAYLEGAQKIVDFMGQLWTSSRLCDVILQATDQDLMAHKIALGAYSNLLADKFNSVEPGQVVSLCLTQYHSDVINIILRFIYTTEVHISDAILDPLLGCSLDTGVTTLIHMCEDHMSRFGVETALFYHSLADKYSLVQLRNCLYQFICNNIETISYSNSFLSLSSDWLSRLMADDNLVVSSELLIFQAIVRWIDFNRQERLGRAPQLLRCVRLQLISPQLLVSEVETEEHIFSNMECFNMLYQAIKYHALDLSGSPLVSNFPRSARRAQAGESPRTQSSPTHPQTHQAASLEVKPVPDPYIVQSTAHSQTAQPIVFSMGASSQKQQEQQQQQSLQQQANTRPRAYSVPVNRVNNNQQTVLNPASLDNLTVSGGEQRHLLAVAVGGIDLQSMDRDMPGKCVHKFDPQTNRWMPMTTLKHYTHHHGVAALNGLLYVVGGCVYDSEHPELLGLATGMNYVYDPSARMWRVLASMKEERAYLGLAGQGSRLYAVGGEDSEKRKSDTIECYDVTRNTWTYLARMPNGGRIGAAVQVFKNQLWIVGGFNKAHTSSPVLDEVLCFDLLQERWITRQPLPVALCHSGLVEACGRLYLIGGRTKMETPQSRIASLASILVYNEAEDSWNHVANMSVPRHDCGCTAIGSKIFIVGGMKTPSPFCLASVECYDVEENQWHPDVGNLPYAAAGIACCSLSA